MKTLPAVLLFLVYFFSSQSAHSQDTLADRIPVEDSVMQDTIIARNPHFVVRPYTIPHFEMQDTVVARERNYAYPPNIYATRDSLDLIKDSIRAYNLLMAKMQDTVVLREAAFVVRDLYAAKDSMAAASGPRLSKRDSLIKAFRDSLNNIGNALMLAAEMQDTTVFLESSFIVRNMYVERDSIQAIRDAARASLVLAARMQDTTIERDPAFVVLSRYTKNDKYDAFRDSVWTHLAEAAKMRDTTIALEPSFVVARVYAEMDKLNAIRDSIARPTLMQDTIISRDSSFIINNIYAFRDSMEAVNDSLMALTDSLYTDSVNRHWAGWRKFEVDSRHSYTLNSQKVLKGKSKTALQYNIADFYLYLNGDRVRPTGTQNEFFAAGCLSFVYDDTLLLNSGLGFKVGVGVGIKIIEGHFMGTLHANANNTEVFKLYKEDSIYLKSVTVEPVTQSLKLQSLPSDGSNDIIIGEYQATYKRFYQKNEIEDDEIRKYTVRIIFRCRVSGGIHSISSSHASNGK
jgi:hypothetical protein